MKKLMMGLLTLTAIVSYQAAKAQTADEIIDKYIAAIGGKEKLAALKSVKKTGSLSMQGMDIGITISVVNGVGFRNDISVPGMGEGYQITTPSKGWSFMPFQGQASPEQVPDEQLKSSQHLIDVQGLLVNYKEKGSQVELLGKEKVDSAECFKLKLTNKLGKTFTFFIDPKTWYCVKSISKGPSPNGGETDMESVYSDFKKNDEGYVFPFAQTNPRGTIVFTSIETNKPIDATIFDVK